MKHFPGLLRPLASGVLVAITLASISLVSVWGQQEKTQESRTNAPSVSGATRYRVFHADGTSATLDDIIARARDVDAIFLGESHDDPLAHELELEVLKRLSEDKSNKHGVVLSMEMFERDVQSILDEYLTGLITEREFLDSSRPWKNYKTDYRPLIEYAREHKIPVIAANAPGRYVNRVSRLGKSSLDQLNKGAKATLPPLPYADASSRYEQEFRKVMEEAMAPPKPDPAKPEPAKPESPADKKTEETKPADRKSEPSHKIANLKNALESQSLWDASMAYSIAQVLKAHPGAHIVQVNGGFHSQYRLGILEHLSRYRPKTTSVVVTMEPEKDLANFDQKKFEEEKLKDRGDFVIITDESLPRSGKSTSAPASPSDPAKAESKK